MCVLGQVYDERCDNRDSIYLCQASSTWSTSSLASCVYTKPSAADATGLSVQWVKGHVGDGSCDALCAKHGRTCSASAYASLTSVAAAQSTVSGASGIVCSSWNVADYGQGFSQCLSSNCIGSCSVPGGQRCSSPFASSDSQEKICPCDGTHILHTYARLISSCQVVRLRVLWPK